MSLPGDINGSNSFSWMTPQRQQMRPVQSAQQARRPRSGVPKRRARSAIRPKSSRGNPRRLQRIHKSNWLTMAPPPSHKSNPASLAGPKETPVPASLLGEFEDLDKVDEKTRYLLNYYMAFDEFSEHEGEEVLSKVLGEFTKRCDTQAQWDAVHQHCVSSIRIGRWTNGIPQPVLDPQNFRVSPKLPNALTAAVCCDCLDKISRIFAAKLNIVHLFDVLKHGLYSCIYRNHNQNDKWFFELEPYFDVADKLQKDKTELEEINSGSVEDKFMHACHALVPDELQTMIVHACTHALGGHTKAVEVMGKLFLQLHLDSQHYFLDSLAVEVDNTPALLSRSLQLYLCNSLLQHMPGGRIEQAKVLLDACNDEERGFLLSSLLDTTTAALEDLEDKSDNSAENGSAEGRAKFTKNVASIIALADGNKDFLLKVLKKNIPMVQLLMLEHPNMAKKLFKGKNGGLLKMTLNLKPSVTPQSAAIENEDDSSDSEESEKEEELEPKEEGSSYYVAPTIESTPQESPILPRRASKIWNNSDSKELVCQMAAVRTAPDSPDSQETEFVALTMMNLSCQSPFIEEDETMITETLGQMRDHIRASLGNDAPAAKELATLAFVVDGVEYKDDENNMPIFTLLPELAKAETFYLSIVLVRKGAWEQIESLTDDALHVIESEVSHELKSHLRGLDTEFDPSEIIYSGGDITAYDDGWRVITDAKLLSEGQGAPADAVSVECVEVPAGTYVFVDIPQRAEPGKLISFIWPALGQRVVFAVPDGGIMPGEAVKVQMPHEDEGGGRTNQPRQLKTTGGRLFASHSTSSGVSQASTIDKDTQIKELERRLLGMTKHQEQLVQQRVDMMLQNKGISYPNQQDRPSDQEGKSNKEHFAPQRFKKLKAELVSARLELEKAECAGMEFGLKKISAGKAKVKQLETAVEEAKAESHEVSSSLPSLAEYSEMLQQDRQGQRLMRKTARKIEKLAHNVAKSMNTDALLLEFQEGSRSMFDALLGQLYVVSTAAQATADSGQGGVGAAAEIQWIIKTLETLKHSPLDERASLLVSLKHADPNPTPVPLARILSKTPSCKLSPLEWLEGLDLQSKISVYCQLKKEFLLADGGRSSYNESEQELLSVALEAVETDVEAAKETAEDPVAPVNEWSRFLKGYSSPEAQKAAMFLSGQRKASLPGKKKKTKGVSLSKEKLRSFILEIYTNKYKADRVQSKHGQAPGQLTNYVMEHMLFKYGAKKLVQKRLVSFIEALHQYTPKDPFVLTFARFCNLGDDPLDTETLSSFLWTLQQLQKHLVNITPKDKKNVDVVPAAVDQKDLPLVPLKIAKKQMSALLSLFKYIENAKFKKRITDKAFKVSLHTRAANQMYVGVATFMDIYFEAWSAENKQEKETLCTLFAQADSDNSNHLDFDEFRALIQKASGKHNLSDQEIRHMYVQACSSTDGGEVTQSVFVKFAQTELKKYLANDMLAQAQEAVQSEQTQHMVLLNDSVRNSFDKFDMNGDGVMDVKELIPLVVDLGKSISEEEMQQLLPTLDLDGSGTVDYSEFINWWREYGVRDVFNKYDKDHGGSINSNELGQMLQDMGMYATEDRKSEVLAELDPNGDGEISFTEFLEWWSVFDIRETFTRYDADASGTVSYEELANLVKDLGVNLGPGQLQEAIDILDTDRSGQLEFDEFLPWFRQMNSQEHDKKRSASPQKRKQRVAKTPAVQSQIIVPNSFEDTKALLNRVAEQYSWGELTDFLKSQPPPANRIHPAV